MTVPTQPLFRGGARFVSAESSAHKLVMASETLVIDLKAPSQSGDLLFQRTGADESCGLITQVPHDQSQQNRPRMCRHMHAIDCGPMLLGIERGYHGDVRRPCERLGGLSVLKKGPVGSQLIDGR